jgi:hypothetical protein
MSTEALEGVCQHAIEADTIDQRSDRRLYVQNHPCYEQKLIDGDSTDPQERMENRRVTYVRKDCRGNQSCPHYNV